MAQLQAGALCCLTSSPARAVSRRLRQLSAVCCCASTGNANMRQQHHCSFVCAPWSWHSSCCPSDSTCCERATFLAVW